MKLNSKNLNPSNLFSNDPLKDREAQVIVLYSIGTLTQEYGISDISFETLVQFLKNEFKVNPKKVKIYLSNFLTKQVSEEGVTIMGGHIRLSEPILLETEEIFFNMVHEVQKRLRRYFMFPVFLHKSIDRLNEQLKESARIEYLFRSDIREKIREQITKAEKSILIMLAYYRDDYYFFPDLLSMKLKNGVQIKILLRRRGKEEYNNEQQMKALLSKIKPKKGTFEFRFWTTSEDMGYLHAKQYVIDEEELIVCSANFTRQAFERNVEVGICTNEKRCVASAVKCFQELWAMKNAKEEII